MVSKRRVDQLAFPLDNEVGFLSPNERQKLSSLRFPKRRTEWLHGRWTAKHLLSVSSTEWQAIPYDQIEVANATGGVPYYITYEKDLPIPLSISHREKLAFCALSFDSGYYIGADVEKIEPYPASFADTFFTREEIDAIHSYDAQQRDIWVVLVWSLKEAILKALGEGLRLDTRQIKIQPISGLDIDDSVWRSVEFKLDLPMPGSWQSWWRRYEDYILTISVHELEGSRQFDLQQHILDGDLPVWL